MEYIETVCGVCNKSFQVMKWKLGQGRGKTCSKECRHEWQKSVVGGEKSAWWKGGSYINRAGYKYILSKDHPFRNEVGNGYMAEHRLVMEDSIGRYLKRNEVVHHINHDKLDNRIENLKLLQNNTEHMHEHARSKNISCICGRRIFARDMCFTHWERFHKTGIADFSEIRHRSADRSRK